MKLFYLSALAFVFISTTALAMTGGIKELSVLNPKTTYRKFFSDIPVLVEHNKDFPIVSAQSAMAVDLGSGVYLYEKDPQKALLPASTTKILTALVAMENYNLNDVVTVDVGKVVGQKMGLVSGETITVENLLYGLLVYSANDAAEALAAYYPTGREEFVLQMNKLAKGMGLTNSNFVNPTGLDSADQYSTTKDLITISEYAMGIPLFANIVGTKEKIVTDTSGKIIHRLTNINKLLGKVDGVMGVKTGWTENARENLVTYIDRDGRKVMIAVMGSQDRFGETRELIDWIFANYRWESVSISYFK